MREVLCLVLGGGRGRRLYPLTRERSKPAVPFAGKYRLVDIPISNSLNSGFNHIYVLTQFNSESLNKHIARTYKLEPFSQGFVDIMAAEQSMESTDWFQGSADAVRRCLKHFNNPQVQYVLVLSGDQLYKMDFRKLLEFHRRKRAEITIACNGVEPESIKEFGIICADKKGRINNFIEKPENEKIVHKMALEKYKKRFYLASMGIYLFCKDVLVEILKHNQKTDFGREVIPDSFSHKLTYAYLHQGYWRDIGTIKTFYRENLVFTEAVPPLDLFDEQWQIFTRPRYLPPAKIQDCRLDKTIVAEGSILRKCNISRSIIGLRSRIDESSQIEDAVIMGADFYQSLQDVKAQISQGIPAIGIGKNCLIKKAIIDKNARLGDGVKIINERNIQSFDGEKYSIREGIVVIPKNTVIAKGTII